MINSNETGLRWNLREARMKTKRGEGDNTLGNKVLLPSSSELRSRQSVRATFKLSEDAINTIRLAADHLSIKQKTLIDHLMEDTRSLDLIAAGIESAKFRGLRRIQKTFVVSRKTVSCLDETSKKFDAPRDALVEYSIQRLLPVMEEERERHRKRIQMMDEIAEYVKQGEGILGKSRELLGKDDPVCEKIKVALRAWSKAHRGIASLLKKGKQLC
jgi:hypothetical protein